MTTGIENHRKFRVTKYTLASLLVLRFIFTVLYVLCLRQSGGLADYSPSKLGFEPMTTTDDDGDRDQENMTSPSAELHRHPHHPHPVTRVLLLPHMSPKCLDLGLTIVISLTDLLVLISGILGTLMDSYHLIMIYSVSSVLESILIFLKFSIPRATHYDPMGSHHHHSSPVLIPLMMMTIFFASLGFFLLRVLLRRQAVKMVQWLRGDEDHSRKFLRRQSSFNM